MKGPQDNLTIGELVDTVNRELGLAEPVPGVDECRPVTRRTVHYYVGEGLLPPPRGAGPESRYGRRHVLLLKLIKLCQQRHLPLRKIRGIVETMEGLSDRELERRVRQMAAQSDAGPIEPMYARIWPEPAFPGIRRSLSLHRDLDHAEPDLAWDVWSHPEAVCECRIPDAGGERDLWRREDLGDGVELLWKMSGDARRDAAMEEFVRECRALLRRWRARLDRK